MIYEYECKIHGLFEEMQKMSDPPLEECPQCAQEGRRTHQCTACGTTVYSVPDAQPEVCPKNGSECQLSEAHPVKPKKLISLSSFRLIGGCWASDNYK